MEQETKGLDEEKNIFNKEFFAVGKARVKSWEAIFLVGIISGFVGGVIWVSSQRIVLESDLGAANTFGVLSTERWKAYSDQEFGFEVKYLSSNIDESGERVSYMAGDWRDIYLGDNKIVGIGVGPLKFAVLKDESLRKLSEKLFDGYLEDEECERILISGSSILVNMVECNTENGVVSHALIKGDDYDIFVEGNSYIENEVFGVLSHRLISHCKF